MIDSHFLYTYVDGVDIVTIDTLSMNVVERHALPDRFMPFVHGVITSLSFFFTDEDLLVKRFFLNKTPYIIERSLNDSFNLYGRFNQAAYDVFLVAAAMLQYEVVDGFGDKIRFI